MRSNFSIFDYYKTESDVHNLSSISKILSMLLIFFCLVIADSFVDCFVITFFVFIIMLWSNISFRFLIKNISLFKILILFVVIVVSLLFWNFYAGILWGIKIFDMFLYVSLFAMTTSFISIIYGFYNVLKPFRFFIDVYDVSLRLGLGIKFFSLLYSESERINKSLVLRGGNSKDMKFKDRIKCFFCNINWVFKNSYLQMFKIKNTMYLENYGIDSGICNYRLNKWGKTDTILLVISVIIVIIIFIY